MNYDKEVKTPAELEREAGLRSTHNTREGIDEKIMEMSDVLGDKINELLEYRGISDNGKSMRGGCDKIIMPFIVRKFNELLHQELQKAREEERERCIKVVDDYSKSMSKLHSKMIGTTHEDSKMMLAFDMHSRLIAVKHITEKMNHSELDQAPESSRKLPNYPS